MWGINISHWNAIPPYWIRVPSLWGIILFYHIKFVFNPFTNLPVASHGKCIGFTRMHALFALLGRKFSTPMCLLILSRPACSVKNWNLKIIPKIKKCNIKNPCTNYTRLVCTCFNAFLMRNPKMAMKIWILRKKWNFLACSLHSTLLWKGLNLNSTAVFCSTLESTK